MVLVLCATTWNTARADEKSAEQPIMGPEAPAYADKSKIVAVYWGDHGDLEKAVREGVEKLNEAANRIEVRWIDAELDGDLPDDIHGLLFIGSPAMQTRSDKPTQVPKAWLDRVRSGKLAVVGVCGAIAAFPNSKEWQSLFGASVVGQPWTDEGPPVYLKSEDTLHPACIPFGAEWLMIGPLYQFGPPYDARKLYVLQRINAETTDLSITDANRKDRDYAVSWAHYFGKGRVFYTALGCTVDAWRDEAFRNHLAGGLGWALGHYPASRPIPPHENRTYQTTENGVRYYDLRVGDGASPKNYCHVTLDFVGQMANGTEFTNTYRINEPYRFQIGLSQVVRGLEEGIMSMRVGGKRVLEIPPELAYGTRGWEAIPPNTLLIFEVELLKVE
ncbi:MAG: FKBP-type peptidyl-prolyl cis-trans isomerase [Phycisphaerae bacterium]